MESISIFEIIKIGIGPSSSHTMGPWRAAEMFLNELSTAGLTDEVIELTIHLYGSLALTGTGHGTDIALLMGLSGEKYKEINTDKIDKKVAHIYRKKMIALGGTHTLQFDPHDQIIFHYAEFLPYHANGLEIVAVKNDQTEYRKKYYSLGGGFVASEDEKVSFKSEITTPYPCHQARAISDYCKRLEVSVSGLVLLNEQAWKSEAEVKRNAIGLWTEMKSCIFRGISKEGYLPGNLSVKRRAAMMNKSLLSERIYDDVAEWIQDIKKSDHSFKNINSWISCFALAVNEENASFGRVVTAPTNGASGVIPAVMMYAHCFENIVEEELIKFILVAGEIGTLFKKNATISAAVGGCQAEIGVSSAMAAAGLTEVLGGSPEQVLMAAEIAMEHHLGLTCDPIGGLVQIPCIERNTMGAIKAITACNIALRSDPGAAKVSLDQVIKTMWETALDMHNHYKETSEGGLAANVAVNVVEC